MGQKQSTEAAQYTKLYTTDELNHLIDDYEASLVDDKDDSSDDLLSTNAFSTAMPNQRSVILSEAFRNWVFLREPNADLINIHKQFVLQVNGAFADLLKSLNKLGINNNRKFEMIGETLAPPAEHQRPSLVYDTQMLLISFITSLTQAKYYDEAKIIHRFIRIFKNNARAQHDPDEQKGIAGLTARACFHGLQLQDAAIVDGHILERSLRDKFFHFYLAALLYLTTRHPVFENDYAIETYDIYERMNKRFDELGLGMAVNPALAAADLPNFFLDALKNHYKEIAKKFYGSEDKKAAKAVYTFFIKKIASVAAFDKTTDRAEAMHNFIFVLKQLYLADASETKDTQIYLRALRHFLQIPQLDKDIDTWFDECIVRTLFERRRTFATPFSPDKYSVTLEEQQDYCRHLTQAYEEQVAQNSILSAQLQQETFSLKVRNNDLEQQLAAVQHQLKTLSLRTDEPSSAKEIKVTITPPTSPPSSPTMGIYHLHRREKQTAPSSESSSPRERRKLSSPTPPIERPSSIGRALSADALKHKKYK